MKKLLLLGVTLLVISCGLSACAFSHYTKNNIGTAEESIKNAATQISAFEILPTMNSKSNAKNQVWVGTFQLVWNDLMNELVKHPIEFYGTKSIIAENLNKQSFTADDLNESSYYKKWGLASPELKKEIEKGIKDKFNEKSDILGGFDFTPAEGKYLLYAMLKKDFQYIKPFTKLDDAPFNGSEGNVKYFGIDENSTPELKSTINVLFYNNTNDYAVRLQSKQGDNVYLYRTNDDKTLDVLYSDMISKSKAFTGKTYITKEDKFKAPMLDFKSETSFKELCNKPIIGSNLMISDAIETIQFKMDEAGVILKSEAAIMNALSALPPQYRDKPRYFYFNDRYIIFLQEKEKPYFAMKIDDVKKLQK